MDGVRILNKITYVVENKFSIAFPNFSQLSERLSSFDNDSLKPYVKNRKQTLAEAGFFSNGKEDFTLCYYCGGGIKDWDEEDDPWEVHATCFTYCPFVYLIKGNEYVDSCIVSTKVPRANGRLHKCDHFEKQFIEHDFRDEDDSRACVVCVTGVREVLFLPCKHLGTCTIS